MCCVLSDCLPGVELPHLGMTALLSFCTQSLCAAAVTPLGTSSLVFTAKHAVINFAIFLFSKMMKEDDEVIMAEVIFYYPV